MLYALELLPVGGDTLFANQAEAYESLSDGLKDTSQAYHYLPADKAIAMATRADRIAERGATQEKIILSASILLFPHTQKRGKTLYVNQAHSCHFEGWSMAESDGLLNFIYAHQIKEELSVVTSGKRRCGDMG